MSNKRRARTTGRPPAPGRVAPAAKAPALPVDPAPAAANLFRTAKPAHPAARPPVVATPAPPAPAPTASPDAAPVATPAPGLRAPSVTADQLEVTSFACGPVEGAQPQALGLTYWFDAPQQGPTSPVTVAFTGRLEGGSGTDDSFVTYATVDPVLPGSGRIAITTRVLSLATGTWHVAAAPVTSADGVGAPVAPVTGTGTTAFAPVVRVRAPGVRLGAWPGLVALGTAVALSTQAVLAAGRDLAVLRVSLLTFLACLIGVLGAKAYYLATHRGQSTGLLTVGMSVQGFVLASIGTLALGSLATGTPVGTVLDVTTPGLLFGMAIGRLGCWLGGCCAGRPTASRWGLWSSDRRLGVRRIPVQLVESTVAGLLGVTALLLVVLVRPVGGAVFVGGLAAYTLARQVLFPLRDLPRATSWGRVVTMGLSATLVVADVAVVLAS